MTVELSERSGYTIAGLLERPEVQMPTHKKADHIAKGYGAEWFEYDSDLFSLNRVEALLGEKHIFPAVQKRGKTILLNGSMPIRPYRDRKDHFERNLGMNLEKRIPVEVVIYNDAGIGFVEINTTDEYANHPKYRSLVDKLCDSRARAVFDRYALDVLRPLRLLGQFD